MDSPTGSPPAESPISPASGPSLARQLDDFAATLSDRELQVLQRVFTLAMNPLERLRFLDPQPLLSPSEWEALRGALPE